MPLEPNPPQKHIYTQEISQMMYVFGEVKETEEETANIVEQLVQSQVIETLSQALQIAQSRSARSPASEDFLFLIRNDRLKVNRLKSFLSWKDVRRNVKKDDTEVIDIDEENGPARKKSKIKFGWDLLTCLSSCLDDDEIDDDDEDVKAAYNDQISRLRSADDLTKTMSREDYLFFSECRQASFTYKKAKRFKEWFILLIVGA